MKSPLLLRGFSVDPSYCGERARQLAFFSHGPVATQLNSPMTFLISENESGRTTLLEALATACGTRPGGGRSYNETDHDRPDTALSHAVDISLGERRLKGLFCAPSLLAARVDASSSKGKRSFLKKRTKKLLFLGLAARE